jgi:hypothetical protein
MNTTTLADNIISQLEPLKDADPQLLVEHFQVWAKKLASKKCSGIITTTIYTHGISLTRYLK